MSELRDCRRTSLHWRNMPAFSMWVLSFRSSSTESYGLCWAVRIGVALARFRVAASKCATRADSAGSCASMTDRANGVGGGLTPAREVYGGGSAEDVGVFVAGSGDDWRVRCWIEGRVVRKLSDRDCLFGWCCLTGRCCLIRWCCLTSGNCMAGWNSLAGWKRMAGWNCMADWDCMTGWHRFAGSNDACGRVSLGFWHSSNDGSNVVSRSDVGCGWMLGIDKFLLHCWGRSWRKYLEDNDWHLGWTWVFWMHVSESAFIWVLVDRWITYLAQTRASSHAWLLRLPYRIRSVHKGNHLGCWAEAHWPSRCSCRR